MCWSGVMVALVFATASAVGDRSGCGSCVDGLVSRCVELAADCRTVARACGLHCVVLGRTPSGSVPMVGESVVCGVGLRGVPGCVVQLDVLVGCDGCASISLGDGVAGDGSDRSVGPVSIAQSPWALRSLLRVARACEFQTRHDRYFDFDREDCTRFPQRSQVWQTLTAAWFQFVSERVIFADVGGGFSVVGRRASSVIPRLGRPRSCAVAVHSRSVSAASTAPRVCVEMQKRQRAWDHRARAGTRELGSTTCRCALRRQAP
jgi:hypothetical protein